MLFEVREYLNFLIMSTNQHGVHSPFVFDLVTKCFYDKKHYSTYKNLKNYRADLVSDKSFISISDFGAGSRVFKSNERQISQIAKTSAISASRAKLLYRLINYFNPKEILEIGTSLGIATASMAFADKKTSITTIEGCPETAAVAEKQFENFNFDNVNLICTQFDDYFKKIDSEKFDLIYFDGNHTKEATLSYFNSLLRTTNNETCWIFDDIHWSEEMQQAWIEIKSHPLVTVTIDTFQWGFVFFRKEQQKENFIIRV